MAALVDTLAENHQDLGERILSHIPALTGVRPPDLLAFYDAIVDAQVTRRLPSELIISSFVMLTVDSGR